MVNPIQQQVKRSWWDRGMVWPGFWAALIVILVLLSIGCASPYKNMNLDKLDSRDPTVRVMAIKWAGQNSEQQAVPRLVEFLASDDESLRFYAIKALKQITGTDNGYDYKDGAWLRRQALQKWRKYVQENFPDYTNRE